MWKYDEKIYNFSEEHICSLMQNISFPNEVRVSKKIIVMVVPEHNAMSGGIFSFFSIVEQMRRLKRHHGCEIIMMTRPTGTGVTYYRNTNFRNSENVYRFSQITLCKDAEEVYLHIPEYATKYFYNDLTGEECEYLLNPKRKIYINIMNQNIKLMPDRNSFAPLRIISHDITQSVAHHAYFSQEMTDRYCLPTLLLPAYTDLSAYAPSHFTEKEKIIIYSPDKAPHKRQILSKISRAFPDFKLIEIRDITFDAFMDLATRCMFSITFGEGFDGYLAQPIHQGGIGFSIYNRDFFPSPDYLRYKNIFPDKDSFIENICDRIYEFSHSEKLYVDTNKELVDRYDDLYSKDEYIEKIKRLTLRQFELMPSRG
ncbi:hypothetical protein [Aquisediminimonas sediminicola]|uniref:hypothetical protein n=1 Tax=Alteraquisediminimonas sediminicola TaxID=2676787 RepID=UPI001C8ED7C1|nr:hypothetical protein [Aquisediminimonas sediminicola]